MQKLLCTRDKATYNGNNGRIHSYIPQSTNSLILVSGYISIWVYFVIYWHTLRWKETTKYNHWNNVLSTDKTLGSLERREEKKKHNIPISSFSCFLIRKLPFPLLQQLPIPAHFQKGKNGWSYLQASSGTTAKRVNSTHCWAFISTSLCACTLYRIF